MALQAHPPTPEERDLYYYGLPSCPKLVARSSTKVWQKSIMTSGTYSSLCPKVLRPAGQHPVFNRLWNDATSSLRTQILQTIKSAPDWAAVDIMRVGLPDDLHTTLLISVKPDSLTWERGYDIALQCKKISEQHEIYNIDCEIPSARFS